MADQELIAQVENEIERLRERINDLEEFLKLLQETRSHTSLS